MEKKWRLRRTDRAAADRLAEECGLTAFQAALLCGRGCDTPAKVREFFSGDLEGGVETPDIMKGVPEAAERIRRALKNGEKICIFGDYDADGVTATVIMYQYLTSLGGDVSWMLPSREEGGYGMSDAAIDGIAADGARLIITVDNGISAAEEIAHAASLGMDVIVTDHHKPPQQLPACIIVDPWQPGCPSSFKELCGAGVAFKLVCAMEGGDIEGAFARFGDIVTLGTIADIMSLTGENRIMVRRGIPMMRQTRNIGLRTLIRNLKLRKLFDSQDIAYIISPRLNAAGRMNDAAAAVKLLLSRDEQEAQAYCLQLEKYNAQRKKLEETVFTEAKELLSSRPQLMYDPVGVVWGKGWKSGVVGIVAAKLSGVYGKPFVVLASDGENATGSARSIDSFNIYDAVKSCGDCLTRFGGHSQSVGLSLRAADIEEFRRRINAYADAAGPAEADIVEADMEIGIEDIGPALPEQLAALEPFGRDNLFPVFLLRDVRISSVSTMRNGRHCRVQAEKNFRSAELLMFGRDAETLMFSAGDRADVLLTVELKEFGGMTKVSAVIKDMHFSGFDQEAYFAGKTGFIRTMRGKEAPAEKISPDDVAAVYRELRRVGSITNGNYFAYSMQDKMSFYKTLICLEILRQMGLMRFENGAVRRVPADRKHSLRESELFRLSES